MNRLPLAATLFAALALPAFLASAAQLDDPRGSAAGSFGGASVSIDYGRPTLDGRSVDELLAMLPEERVWRAGENQVTILETSGAVAIGGETVPAGRYSLYLHIPASGGWSLLVNRNQGIRLGDLSSQAPADMHDEMWPAVGPYGSIADEEVIHIPLVEAEAEEDGRRFRIAVEGLRIKGLSIQSPADKHEEMRPAVGRYGSIADEEVVRIPLTEAMAEGDGDRFHITIEGGMLRFSWGGVAHQTTIGSP